MRTDTIPLFLRLALIMACFSVIGSAQPDNSDPKPNTVLAVVGDQKIYYYQIQVSQDEIETIVQTAARESAVKSKDAHSSEISTIQLKRDLETRRLKSIIGNLLYEQVVQELKPRVSNTEIERELAALPGGIDFEARVKRIHAIATMYRRSLEEIDAGAEIETVYPKIGAGDLKISRKTWEQALAFFRTVKGKETLEEQIKITGDVLRARANEEAKKRVIDRKLNEIIDEQLSLQDTKFLTYKKIFPDNIQSGELEGARLEAWGYLDHAREKWWEVMYANRVRIIDTRFK